MNSSQNLIGPRTPDGARQGGAREWWIKTLDIDPELEYRDGIIRVVFDESSHAWYFAYKCDDPFFILDRRSNTLPSFDFMLPSPKLMALTRLFLYRNIMNDLGLKPDINVITSKEIVSC